MSEVRLPTHRIHTMSSFGQTFPSSRPSPYPQDSSHATSTNQSPFPDPRDRAACTRFRLRRKARKRTFHPTSTSRSHELELKQDIVHLWKHVNELGNLVAMQSKLLGQLFLARCPSGPPLSSSAQTSTMPGPHTTSSVADVFSQTSAMPGPHSTRSTEDPIPSPAPHASLTKAAPDVHPESSHTVSNLPSFGNPSTPPAPDEVRRALSGVFGDDSSTSSRASDHRSNASSTAQNLPGLKGMFNKGPKVKRKRLS